MYKPQYFTLEELLKTSYKVTNLPSWEVIEHLNELVQFLDALRRDYGKPIYVSSGFRCPQLNSLVGGVANSVHMRGWAADVYAKDMAGFISFIKSWAPGKAFDQIIIETSKTSRWVHIGIRNNKGEQRRKLFSMAV